MARIFLLLAFVVLVFLAWSYTRRRLVVSRRTGGQKRDPNAPVAMIECPQCGTHFPEDEAVLGDGRRYCSERCRNKARTARH